LAAAGVRNVLLIPIGFVCDHVEILYDIDILFRQYGEKRGVSVRRSESLNDSPIFASALADLVNSRIDKLAGVKCQAPMEGAVGAGCLPLGAQRPKRSQS